MVKKVEDVSGNVLQSAAASERFIKTIGLGWASFVEDCRRMAGHDIYVTGLSIRGNPGADGEFLVVLRADSLEGKLVAFHNTTDIYTLWQGLSNRIQAGALSWKEDQYAG